ncbi:MAG TPA: 3'(2'),5'-bisphosphate nucleotidase CysQ [Nitrosopumilaceae archaeon]|jgi:3'(2'), 5'-bisphosphate nucleotidase|nr:3'(2'),5'-bisphosphate nucleotidase CysQ [Nitrosopumilaceae archaeon]
MLFYNNFLNTAIHAALEAGKEILEVYDTPFKVKYKSDSSPVTKADKRANKRIEELLASTQIPCITEEGEHLPYSIRKTWNKVWIADPLDGTKEFIKRNGEFTVNIALVEEGKPVIGVIYSPVFKDLYFAAKGSGAFKTNKEVVMEISDSSGQIDLTYIISNSTRLPYPKDKKTYTVVASRSHLSTEVYHHIQQLKREKGEVACINIGSSLKMCLVAEGTADEYPRFGATMEWDTCAGQCIVEEAGGMFLDFETQLPIRYNREELKNNWFIVKGLKT